MIRTRSDASTPTRTPAGGVSARLLWKYGLFFCEVHGTEAKARCLEELYDDALQFLELFDARHVRMMNPEVLRIVRTGVGEFPDWPEPDSAQALLAAYPVIPERVDLDFSGVRLRLRGGL